MSSVSSTQRIPHRRAGRMFCGFTLVETLISMALMSILVVTCGGLLLLATRALPARQDPVERDLDAAQALNQMVADLQYATTVTSLTSTAVTFQVADRQHGSAGPETIAWAWSGITAAPLTRAYNGNPAINLLDAVRSFAITKTASNDKVTGLRLQLTAPDGQTIHAYVFLPNEPEDPAP